MKNGTEILFEEKQYLGHNRLSIAIRTLLAIFCFTAYYWSENPNPVQVSFIRLGSYPIKAIDNSRRVKIEFHGIKSLRKSRYKKNSLRRAVYNLHNLGIIRFYTSGEEFIEISDREGFVYRIGTQRALELHKILKEQIKLSGT